VLPSPLQIGHHKVGVKKIGVILGGGEVPVWFNGWRMDEGGFEVKRRFSFQEHPDVKL